MANTDIIAEVSVDRQEWLFAKANRRRMIRKQVMRALYHSARTLAFEQHRSPSAFVGEPETVDDDSSPNVIVRQRFSTRSL